MKWYHRLYCTLIMFVLTTTVVHAQTVLTLNPGDQAGKATLQDIAWLSGYWTGTGLGGDCEELWLPPQDSSMAGIFRFREKGTIQFSEYMHIVQEGNSLTVQLKHFSRDLTAWEEKEKWTRFKLVKVDGQTAYFHGLTYHRKGKNLYIWLQLKNGDKTTTEEFRLKRTRL